MRDAVFRAILLMRRAEAFLRELSTERIAREGFALEMLANGRDVPDLDGLSQSQHTLGRGSPTSHLH